MKKTSEQWLNAAADDLRVVTRIASDEYLTHMVAFHSQQCIEKSLKANSGDSLPILPLN